MHTHHGLRDHIHHGSTEGKRVLCNTSNTLAQQLKSTQKAMFGHTHLKRALGTFAHLATSDTPVKLGVFGGTFNPVHMGHLVCAASVYDSLNLDGILFVPTGAPYQKASHELVDAQARITMLRLALSTTPAFDVSAIDIDRPGNTYTYDTLVHLRELLPDCVSLYWISGADSFESMDSWYLSERLASLASFVACTREGYTPHIPKCMQHACVHICDVPALAISSNMIRSRCEQGASISFLTPLSVENFIIRQGLYKNLTQHDSSGEASNERFKQDESYSAALHICLGDMSSFQDKIANTQEFYEYQTALRERLKPRRFEHSLRVSEYAYVMACVYGVDTHAAALAGLLHDWDKALSPEELHEQALKSGIKASDLKRLPSCVLHSLTAPFSLRERYPHLPDDVCRAIGRHTCAAKNMSDLDKLIFVADMLEPARHFPGVETLRSFVGTLSLDELFYRCYKSTIMYLISHDLPLSPKSLKVLRCARKQAFRHAVRSEY